MKENFTIGIDLGGTKISAGLVMIKTGRVKNMMVVPTEARKGRLQILQNLVKVTRSIYQPSVTAIGIGATGQVEVDGTVSDYSNLPKSWKRIPLASHLRTVFKVPVSVDNDSRVQVLAECIFGAGKKYQLVLGLNLGTGIGGGIVLRKKLFRGASRTAGEFGHCPVSEENYRCRCGKWGHLEAIASGTGMVNVYHQLTGKKETTFEIFKEARAGKVPARRTIKVMAYYLGRELAHLATAFNPEMIVLGGSIAHTPGLIPLARQIMQHAVVYPSLKATRIAISELGDRAGVIGAALITQNQYFF